MQCNAMLWKELFGCWVDVDGRRETFKTTLICVLRARVPLIPALYLYPVHARDHHIAWNSSQQASAPVTCSVSASVLLPYHSKHTRDMS